MPIDDRNFLLTLEGRGLPDFIKETYLQTEKFKSRIRRPLKMKFRFLFQIPIYSRRHVGLITAGGLGDHINALVVANSLEAALKSKFKFHLQTNNPHNFKYASILFPNIDICKKCLPRKHFHRFLLRTRIEFKESALRHEPRYLKSILPKQILTYDEAELKNLKIADARYPVFGGLVSDLAIAKGMSRLELLCRSLGIESVTRPNLESYSFSNFFEDEFDYITVHDGIDVTQKGQGLATKQLDQATWNRILGEIKYRYPDVKIVQVGTHRSQQLAHVDYDLRSMTTLPDVFNILHRSKLHIDGDSGIARCARVLGIPLVTFFLSTSPVYYGIPGAEAIGPKFCGSCSWWSHEVWNFECPLGMATPICRKTFPWEEIVKRADKYLSQL